MVSGNVLNLSYMFGTKPHNSNACKRICNSHTMGHIFLSPLSAHLFSVNLLSDGMDIDGGGASAEHNHPRAEQEFLLKGPFLLREILKILLG